MLVAMRRCALDACGLYRCAGVYATVAAPGAIRAVDTAVGG